MFVQWPKTARISTIFTSVSTTQCNVLCTQTMKFTSSKANYSNLRNHLLNKHYDVYRIFYDVYRIFYDVNDKSQRKVPKLDRWAIKSDIEVLHMDIPFIDRQAIADVANRHVFQFNIVEDPIFTWAYPH